MSWWQLSRLGLVQAAIGAVVVLLTTTINRVIVVELSLPATVPGLLVALHFGVQLILRPRLGHEYQFEVDRPDGEAVLDQTAAFVDRVTG